MLVLGNSIQTPFSRASTSTYWHYKGSSPIFRPLVEKSINSLGAFRGNKTSKDEFLINETRTDSDFDP